MPILFLTNRLRVHAEARQLGPFAQAALDLGEATEAARPITWSHSFPAASGLGSLLITGPKRLPPGGWKCRIGVPTSRPVNPGASLVSTRIWWLQHPASSGERVPRDGWQTSG